MGLNEPFNLQTMNKKLTMSPRIKSHSNHINMNFMYITNVIGVSYICKTLASVCVAKKTGILHLVHLRKITVNYCHDSKILHINHLFFTIPIKMLFPESRPSIKYTFPENKNIKTKYTLMPTKSYDQTGTFIDIIYGQPLAINRLPYKIPRIIREQIYIHKKSFNNTKIITKRSSKSIYLKL